MQSAGGGGGGGDSVTGTLKHVKSSQGGTGRWYRHGCGGLAVMAQEANS